MKNHEIIEFIRKNKDEINLYDPGKDHSERFLLKMQSRLHRFISIVPYLIRVAVATVLIFAASIMIFNNYIRKLPIIMRVEEKISVVFNAAIGTK
ncbi:MAG TPA: hypothetical protein VK213_04425 [Bacteroidales bacterium]|nr:hypothetical protein [Bacteroidales bacterium]